MKTKIYCKEENWGNLTFYVSVDGKEYFLFEQDFKKSVKDYFKRGVSIDGINNYSLASGVAVRRILDKLPSYLHYVEKEYNVAIYEKSKRQKYSKKSSSYKRESFKWQDYYYAV